MTVDAARRSRRRTPAASREPELFVAPPASIAIGEIDQTIFECPSCSRPLALGVRRCPGCRTRLVRGVALGKASGFIAIGLAVGLLAGAGGGLVFGLSRAASPAAGIASVPSAAPVSGSQGAGSGSGSGGGGTTAPVPSATATTAPTKTAVPTDPAGMPPITRTALGQVVTMNGRLADAATGLRAALRASSFDASDVAQILRSVSADSIYAQQLAGHVTAWSGTSALGSRLGKLYDAVRGAATDGLDASVQNRAAYRAAATAMIKLLDGLPAIDAEVRSAAESAGLELPGAPTVPAAP